MNSFDHEIELKRGDVLRVYLYQNFSKNLSENSCKISKCDWKIVSVLVRFYFLLFFKNGKKNELCRLQNSFF